MPKTLDSYRGIHAYTIVQIVVTAVIFVVTLTKGAPAFPIIIIALVPIRLLLMDRIWSKETLKFVDSWACRSGTPEDNKGRSAVAKDSQQISIKAKDEEIAEKS